MKELVIEIDFNLWKHVLASNEVYSQIRDHFIEFVEGVRHRERRGTEGKRGWNFFFLRHRTRRVLQNDEFGR